MSSYKRRNSRPNLRYYHIGHDTAELFIDNYSIGAISRLTGKVMLRKDLQIPLRRDTVSRILNHESLFPLCYILVISYLNDNSRENNMKNLFNILIISSIRSRIESSISEGRTLLSIEKKKVYGILASTREYGNSFTDDMNYDERKRKSYILLSMIRNDKVEDFFDILLKLYMSVGRPVPDNLIAMLNNEDIIGFRTRAYAFMSGFLSNKIKNV